MMVYYIYIRAQRQLFQIFTQPIHAIDAKSVTLSRLKSINTIGVELYFWDIFEISLGYFCNILGISFGISFSWGYLWDILGIFWGYLGDHVFIGPLIPYDHWTVGPWDHWSMGPLVLWTIGPLNNWSIGPLVHWSIGPLVHWSIGPLVHWSKCQ